MRSGEKLPGSQSSSSRCWRQVSRASGRVARARMRRAPRCSCARGRGPRCGRRSRTSSRSRPARPRAVAVARARAASPGRSRGRGPGRARPSRRSAGRSRAAARRASRSPRPRRRRRAGGRSPTSSTRPAASRAASPSARLDRLGLAAVVERGRGAVGVDVVDVVGRRGRRRRARARSRARASRPARLRRGQVEGVGGRGVAEQLAEHLGAARSAALGAPRARGRRLPRPCTKPSRRASNGREMPDLRGRAHRLRRRRSRSAVRAASAPPVTTASASPDSIIRIAWPIAWAPAAQADIDAERLARGGRGASRPRRRRRCPSAAAPTSGETAFGPRSRSTSCCSSSEPRPPIPVPITQPIRSGVVAAARRPSRRCASASSAAATASWVKRSMRRASLRLRRSVGSKSEQRPDAVLDPALARGPAVDQRRARRRRAG